MIVTAIVLCGGPAPDPDVADLLPPSSIVLAADSGLDHAVSLGLTVTTLVGDMDSVSASALQQARADGLTIVEHPRDKDATDLDLALSIAADLADRVLVVDPGLGRLDHSIANTLLLGSERFADTEIVAYSGSGMITVVRGTRPLSGEPGDRVSLLAVAAPAHGVDTDGLRWPLEKATLRPGSTLGVSNELVRGSASVTVEEGVVLAVQPARGRFPEGLPATLSTLQDNLPEDHS